MPTLFVGVLIVVLGVNFAFGVGHNLMIAWYGSAAYDDPASITTDQIGTLTNNFVDALQEQVSPQNFNPWAVNAPGAASANSIASFADLGYIRGTLESFGVHQYVTWGITGAIFTLLGVLFFLSYIRGTQAE